MNCESGNCPDPPIGSAPAVAACDPCAEVTCENSLGTIKNLVAEVCELKSRLNNWHALLDKARHRLQANENALAILRKPASPPKNVTINVCGLDEVDEAEKLVVCGGDGAANMLLGECETIVGTSDGGIEKRVLGPTFLSAKQELFSVTTTTSNKVVNIESHDPPKCAKFAIVQLFAEGMTGSSSGATWIDVHYPDIGAVRAHGVYCYPGSDRRQAYSVQLVPIIDGDVKFDITITTTSNKSAKAWLLGFL